MGLRDRIKQRLKAAVGLAQAVHEEAQYPGRPQPHMAARNPLWGGAEDKPPPGTAEHTNASPPPPAPEGMDPYTSNDVAPEKEDDYWFLKGEPVEDGWRDTNPGKTGKKRDGDT